MMYIYMKVVRGTSSLFVIKNESLVFKYTVVLTIIAYWCMYASVARQLGSFSRALESFP